LSLVFVLVLVFVFVLVFVSSVVQGASEVVVVVE